MLHIGILAHSADGAALCFLEIVRESARRLGAHRHPEITLSIQAMGPTLPLYEKNDLAALKDFMAHDAHVLAQAKCDFFVCPDNTAHIVFEADRRETPLVELSAKDGFHVRVAPQSSALPCLGVTHILVRTGEPSAPVDLVLSPRLEWIRSIHGNHLFRVAQRPSAEACRAGGIVLPPAASR